MSKAAQIFEVDREGLAKLLARRGIEFAVMELVQNALDEEPTTVEVTLEKWKERRGYWKLCVVDDSPEGFQNLAESYTLFAESKKKDKPEKRGRFNLGEKLVVAVAFEAHIISTKGGIEFTERGRRRIPTARERGTEVQVILRMTEEQAQMCAKAVRSIIIPAAVKLTFNGVSMPHHAPLVSFTTSLKTEIGDEEGFLRPAMRSTQVDVYQPLLGEEGMLFELGIPVAPTGDAFHVDVRQKVPLTMERDNVPDAWLRKLRAEVLNHVHEQLTPEAASSTWVGDALESAEVSDEAVKAVIHQRYGEKVVISDPSDPEGTKLAVSQGYAVIQPGSFSGAQWKSIKRAGAALPAGQVTPSPKPFTPDGKPLKLLDSSKWTRGHLARVHYAERLAKELLGIELEVVLANDVSWGFNGAYSKGPGEQRAKLYINQGRLGSAWFEGPVTVQVNRFLIHEFAHHSAKDHLADEYHAALCLLGAGLTNLAMNSPEKLKEFY